MNRKLILESLNPGRKKIWDKSLIRTGASLTGWSMCDFSVFQKRVIPCPR